MNRHQRLVLAVLSGVILTSLSRSIVADDVIPVRRWQVECSETTPYPIELIRGETMVLEPQFVMRTVPVTLSNAYEVVFQYRDSSLPTDYCYAITGSVQSVTGGTVRVRWTPAAEATAALYSYSLAVRAVDGQLLRAFGYLRLRDSIGGTATNVPTTFSTIDWSRVQHLSLDASPFLSDAELSQLQRDLTTLDSNKASQAAFDAATNAIRVLIEVATILQGDATGRTSAAVITGIRNIPVGPISASSGSDGFALKYDHDLGYFVLGPVATTGGASISNLVLIGETNIPSSVASTNVGIYRIMRPGYLPSLAVNVGGAEIALFDLLGVTLKRGGLTLLEDWLGCDIRSYDGSVAAPAHSFMADTGSGFYRFAYDGGYAVGLAVVSNLVAFWSTNGMHVTGDLTVNSGYPWRPQTTTTNTPSLYSPRFIGDELVVYTATNLVATYRSYGTATNTWVLE